MEWLIDDQIDWHGLAKQLSLFHGNDEEHGEGAGSADALKAVELLLGEGRLRATVDYYVSRLPGAELARQVL